MTFSLPRTLPFSPEPVGSESSLCSQAVNSPLTGSITVPGDKSISHRALMLGSLAVGKTSVSGLLEGEDVLRTAAALCMLGAKIERAENGHWEIHGCGVGGLSEPEDILDMGNSGTGVRLLMGILATHPFTSVLTGDASLRRRPMARVTTPLAEIGARFVGRSQGRLPLATIGTSTPLPIEYRLPVPSAQIKSAILLAGLNTPGDTIVVEPEASRNHTELMLQAFGADITTEHLSDGEHRIRLRGYPELTGQTVIVPGDPSSAAFPIAAALIVPGSHITIRNVGLNPLRTGLFATIQEMGGDITFINQRLEAGEPVADITVSGSSLKGVRVPAQRAPRMIDEYPVLAILAACAQGETRMEGLAELRVKESDRLAAMSQGLTQCGVDARIEGDSLIVHGTGKAPQGGAMIPVRLDHRIAMSFLTLGLVSASPICIDSAEAITTSFPGFSALMNTLGGRIAPETKP